MLQIRAPHPNHKVTILLPNPEFDDARAPESTITIKRTMTGRLITYIAQSDRVTLNLPLQLTRMKSLELEAFLASYQSAKWEVTLYDGSVWETQLVGEPVSRRATGRLGGKESLIGRELIETLLTLSARRLS